MEIGTWDQLTGEVSPHQTFISHGTLLVLKLNFNNVANNILWRTKMRVQQQASLMPPMEQRAQIPAVGIPRSTFDRSHGHKTTLNSGWLVPFYRDEVLPGDTINFRAHTFARFATLLAPSLITSGLLRSISLFQTVFFGTTGNVFSVAKTIRMILLISSLLKSNRAPVDFLAPKALLMPMASWTILA